MNFKTCLSVVAVTTLISTNALATMITATSSYTWPAESMSDSVTDSSSAVPGSVETGTGPYGGEYGPYARARGNTDGNFGMAAMGAGNNYTAAASFTYQNTFYNSATTAQDFSLGLWLEQGGVSLYLQPETQLNPYSSKASMLAQILINDVVKWSAGVTLTGNATGIEASYTGNFGTLSSANLAFSNADIYWNELNLNVDIGTIAALSSFDFKYVVSVDVEDTYLDDNYYTSARFGDPFSFTATPPISQASFTSTAAPVAVPEPTSLTLLGLGMLGLFGARMKRSQQSA